MLDCSGKAEKPKYMSIKDNEIQVKAEHYFNGYNSAERFASFYYQIRFIEELNPQNVLEIGIGSGVVSSYLKRCGYNVTTCDFDSELRPDYTADIRNLPFEKNSFDVIAVYEVLEHLPFEDFDRILDELHKISRKYVIISLPVACVYFKVIVESNIFKYIFKKSFINFLFSIPQFFRKHRFSGEHYWEMGKKDYSYSKIKKRLKSKYKIIKEFRPDFNSYHYFFVLEKY